MKKNYLLILFCCVYAFANAQYWDESIKETDLSIIQTALNKEKSNGYLTSDLDFWIIKSDASSRALNTWYYYLVQTHNGIEIRNAILNVSIKEGIVKLNNNKFIKALESKINSITPSISPQEAIIKALEYHKLTVNSNLKQLEYNSDKREYTFSRTNDLQSDIKVRLVYDMVSENEIKLTWNVNLDLKRGQHWWNTRIDAQTGDFVSQNDWVTTCNWETKENHSSHKHLKNVKLENNEFSLFKPALKESETSSMMVSSYRALPYYVESPNHGDFELITNPENGIASPNGWHNDGTNYTTTRGNNVIARDDQNGNNGNGPLTSQSSTGLIFDYPYGGPYVDASTYIDAAQTNLFYMINTVHDIYYQYGFDEASGNFQENNFGNGGSGSDPVDADAQDGSGTNNANFSTPTDGANGRMQMFLWDQGTYSGPLLEINNTSVAGNFDALDNAFTAGHVVPGSPITADLVLINDGTPDTSDACEAVVNAAAVNGKIAVVRRGSCNFTAKAINAQNAGALAVLVVNNAAGDISMGGGDAAVSIPAYSINQSDGEAIITEMQTSTVNATFNAAPSGFVNIDGDFDNGVIAHENGHGINIRLVGGRNDSGCVNANESMGEGWGDYIGKILLLKSIDNGIAFSGTGTFVVGQAPDGQGIRPAPYSGDINNNPMTYETLRADTGNATYSIPHGVGAVWAGILWDMTWDLIAVHGFNSDIYDADGSEGNIIALNLVVEGMKLTACDPGFVDGRDAILQADINLYGGANQCIIWSAFARRGVGSSADQGNTNSTSDGAHAYDLPTGLGCTPNYLLTNGDDGTLAFCEGSTSYASFDVVFNAQNGFNTDTGFAASGIPSGSNLVFSPTSISDTGLVELQLSNLDVVAPGNYTITVTPGGDASKNITVDLVVYPTNPDVTDGDTEFSLDSVNYTSFVSGGTINVGENADLDLRIPASVFDGAAVWTAPNGTEYNSNVVNLTNLIDGDTAVDGVWSLDVAFTNDCPSSTFAPQNMTFTVNVDPTLSVDENIIDDFSVFPNPTSGLLNIFTSKNIKDAKISIFDVTGRILLNQVNIQQVNNNRKTVDMSNLAVGAYFISIEYNNLKTVKRVIKN